MEILTLRIISNYEMGEKKWGGKKNEESRAFVY